MKKSNFQIYLIIFLCGLGGLGSESLYLKLFDLTLGSAPLVSFVTVGFFILGSGIGSFFSLKVKRPWLIELSLFSYAIFWYFNLETVSEFNSNILHLFVPIFGINRAAAAMAIGYLLLPAIALGMNFPVFVELSRNAQKTFFMHAFGALVGLLLVEAFAFPHMGIPGSLLLLALVHGLSSVLLYRTKVEIHQKKEFQIDYKILLLGIATGGIQSLWLFIAVLFWSPIYYVQPTVIALAILGQVLGTSLWLLVKIRLVSNLWGLLFGLTASIGLTFYYVVNQSVNLQMISQARSLIMISVFTLPIFIPMGALFSVLANDQHHRFKSSQINLFLSMGNFIGLIVFAFLTKFIGPHWLFILSAVLIAVVLYKETSTKIIASLLMLFSLGLLLVFFCLQISDADYMRMSNLSVNTNIKAEKVIRGIGEMSGVFIDEQPSQYGRPAFKARRLYQTGISPIRVDFNREAVAGGVSLAYAANYKKALVIGTGSGRAAATIASGFAHTDVVDISNTQEELLEYLEADNLSLLQNPKVQFHHLDGILAPFYFHEKYDLILLTTSPFFYRQAGKLFTAENFQRLKSILSEKGVFVFWADLNNGYKANEILAATAKAVFKQQKLFSLNMNLPNDSMTLNLTKGLPGYFLLIQSSEVPIFNSKPVLFQDSELQSILQQGEEKQLFDWPQIKGEPAINSIFRPQREILFQSFP